MITNNGRVIKPKDNPFLHMCEYIFLNMYIYVCACGGQMSILGVVPQEPSTLLCLRQGFPIGNWAHQLGCVGYPVSQEICSPPSSNSGPKADVTSTFLTDLFPKPLR